MKMLSLVSFTLLASSASLVIAQQAPAPSSDGATKAGPADKMDRPNTGSGTPQQKTRPDISPAQKADRQSKEEDNSASDQTSDQKKTQKGSEKERVRGDDKKAGERSTEPKSRPSGTKAADDNSAIDRDRADDTEKRRNTGKTNDGRVGDNASGENDVRANRAEFKNVTGDQRVRVTTTFSRHLVEPTRNLNVAIRVGIAVPRSVRFHSIPQDIIVVAPAYRGYRYFIVGKQLCIVDPDTLEIVDIITLA